MKICMLSRAYVTNCSGGMEDYTQKLCEGLVKKGHEVTLITSRHPQSIPHEIFNGVEIFYLDNPSPLSYKGFFIKAIIKYRELDKIFHFDVLHSQSSAALASLIFSINTPLITTMHGSLKTETQLNPNIFNRKNSKEKILTVLKLYKRIFVHFLTKIMLKKSSAIIVASEFSKRKFSNKKIDHKIRVVYHGIKDDLLKRSDKIEARKALKMNSDQKVLLCLGRIVQEKGIQVVLESLKILDQKRNDIVLVIVGKGPFEDELKKIVEKMRLDNVVFAGFVHDSDKYLYYSAADLFIYPELTSPAFGLVAAEAMACGTAVISSDHEATREVIGDQSFLFTPSNHEELAMLIDDYFSKSDSEKENIINNFNLRQKKLFSYERMISDTEELYKKII
ncbi:glycosyltransferase family 4 protein [Paenibacillus sp. B01]|uniref:glycosyltransferase family 4 protein n=1 Tax=Paenibacillus sp. B01 TaxID=2660554 RepID=UPI00129BFF25|nr:glycosyltransferase family 4 protein [Paenibacillus sp. B01]QGG55273.1 glycosyltransferase [Paenibacillus sp. B01]